MCSCSERAPSRMHMVKHEEGQATIEAAFLFPVLLMMLGLVLQPSLLLYDRCIMNAAASEGCRLLATNTNSDASIKAYLERRLGGIPDLAILHKGDWELSWTDGPEASVTIVNRVQPLPLFGVIAALFNEMDGEDVLQRVEVTSSCIPEWTREQGYDPDSWIGKWD